jgi:ribosomal protein L23
MALFDKTTEEKKEALGSYSRRRVLWLQRLLSRPRITEKSYAMNAQNKYVFEVTKTSTKKSVKRAVEEVYGVNVVAVNIVRLPAKKRISGSESDTVGSRHQ